MATAQQKWVAIINRHDNPLCALQKKILHENPPGRLSCGLLAAAVARKRVDLVEWLLVQGCMDVDGCVVLDPYTESVYTNLIRMYMFAVPLHELYTVWKDTPLLVTLLVMKRDIVCEAAAANHFSLLMHIVTSIDPDVYVPYVQRCVRDFPGTSKYLRVPDGPSSALLPSHNPVRVELLWGDLMYLVKHRRLPPQTRIRAHLDFAGCCDWFFEVPVLKCLERAFGPQHRILGADVTLTSQTVKNLLEVFPGLKTVYGATFMGVTTGIPGFQTSYQMRQHWGLTPPLTIADTMCTNLYALNMMDNTTSMQSVHGCVPEAQFTGILRYPCYRIVHHLVVCMHRAVPVAVPAANLLRLGDGRCVMGDRHTVCIKGPTQEGVAALVKLIHTFIMMTLSPFSTGVKLPRTYVTTPTQTMYFGLCKSNLLPSQLSFLCYFDEGGYAGWCRVLRDPVSVGEVSYGVGEHTVTDVSVAQDKSTCNTCVLNNVRVWYFYEYRAGAEHALWLTL